MSRNFSALAIIVAFIAFAGFLVHAGHWVAGTIIGVALLLSVSVEDGGHV